MARRHAVLMKLKDGVTKGEVKELLELLKRVGDPKWTNGELVKTYEDKYGDPEMYFP